jgi:hypothetical protein
MGLIIPLMIILILISIGCFSESKSERRVLKLILSLIISFYLPFICYVVANVMGSFGFYDGIIIVLYFGLPVIAYAIFQLLIYQIKIFE